MSPSDRFAIIRRRLIEYDLPMANISKASEKEKNIQI